MTKKSGIIQSESIFEMRSLKQIKRLFLKKGITITNTFHKLSDKSNCKPNKKWVDKCSRIYNTSM